MTVPVIITGTRARGSARRTALRARRTGLDREDRGLGVERVEDRLDQQQVGAAVEQAARLLAVGLDQLVEGDVACARIVDVGRDRGGLGRGSERAGDEARLLRRRVLGAGRLRRAWRPRGSSRRPGAPSGSRPARSRCRRRCWSRSGRRRRPGTARGSPGSRAARVSCSSSLLPRDVDRVSRRSARRESPPRQLVALDHGAHRAVEDQDAARQQLAQVGFGGRCVGQGGGEASHSRWCRLPGPARVTRVHRGP